MKSLRNLVGVVFGKMDFRTFLVLGAMLWLALVAVTWAEADESAPKNDDEYNFSWLDPEKKIYVLQNRRYLKANKLMLSVMAGPGFSNAYRSSWNIDPRLAYYFNETWGFEVFYTLTMNTENGIFHALQQATNTLPVVREIRSQVGAEIHWVPWYAKINVFNKILYFDWYFGAGAGGVNAARDDRALAKDPSGPYTLENYFAAFASTGQQFHLSNNLHIRLDFTGAFYRAPVTKDAAGEKAWFPNYNFGLGLGVSL